MSADMNGAARSHLHLPPGLFRLSLASIVVIGHLTKLGIGTAAVELFFVLSGFWIYRMYERKYRFATRPALIFITSRLLRLLPVFVLFNFLTILLHAALRDGVDRRLSWIDIVPNIFVIGYARMLAKPMVPAWSLDIELQFYLLFPAIYLFCKMRPRYVLMFLMAALVVGGGYLSFVTKGDAANVFPFIGFFLGGLMSAKYDWRPPVRLSLAGAALCAAALAVILASPHWRGIIAHGVNTSQYQWDAAINFAMALLLAPLALVSVSCKSGARDRVLGDMSYVVYCSHWMAAMIAGHYFAHARFLERAPAVAGLLLTTYLASFAVLRYVDQPIGRWREAWVERHLKPVG